MTDRIAETIVATAMIGVRTVAMIAATRATTGVMATGIRRRSTNATTAAIADCYAGLVDGLVADEAVDGLPVLRTDTLLADAQGRRRVAAETLAFAEGLA